MEISRHWRLQQARYRLIGEIDTQGNKIFPPRGQGQPYEFSGKGEIYSFTTVREPPQGYEFLGPYTVALIKLTEGPVITAMLTDIDNDQVQIGQPVEMVTRKLTQDGDKGILIYGYKFRPALSR